MPRRAREESPSGLYHVTSRGTGGLRIYVDDADRIGFLAFLARVAEAEDWLVHAYCLRDTHFHLVIRAELERLSKGMQRLKSRYGQYFNERFDRHGHVFEARFDSRPILDDAHALLVSADVAINPVAAGLCERADEWRWSSHRAHLGLDPPPPFLASLESFGALAEGARPAIDVYRLLVDEKEREVRALRAARRLPTAFAD